MIRSVEITKFRGIASGKLDDLSALVVLVGPNGSGKSTVLDALFALGTSEPAKALAGIVELREGLARDPRWLLWKHGTAGGARIVVSTERTTRFETLALHAQSDQIISLIVQDAGTKGKHEQTLPIPQASGAWGGGHVIGGAAIPPLAGVTDIRYLTPLSRNSGSPLHDLYTLAVEQGRRKEALAIFKELAPESEGVEILAQQGVPVLYFVFPDGAIPADLAGDGLRLLLRLSLELATRQGSVVLLEEPETHLHPGAIRQCARAILAAMGRGVQIILTTHSLELIDALLEVLPPADIDKLSLYQLRLQKGELKAHRKSGNEVRFTRAEIERDLR